MGFFSEALYREGVSLSLENTIGIWAFGDGYQTKPPSDGVGLWNSRHSDLFEVKPHDPRLDTLRRIVRAWKDAAIIGKLGPMQ